MARLAGLEKALYYPTDLDTVEMIAQHVKIRGWNAAETWVIDPCIGEGLAVHRFVETLKREPWDRLVTEMYNGSEYARRNVPEISESRNKIFIKGIELDAERAKAARELLGEKNIVEAPMENAAVTGKFDIMWCNPPYTMSNGRRVELNWVEQTSNYLRDGGLAIFILPDMFVSYRREGNTYELDNGRYAREFGAALAKAGYSSSTTLALRFPDESYPQFKQVVVFAKKNSSGYGYGDRNVVIRGTIGDFTTIDRFGTKNEIAYELPNSYNLTKIEPTIARAVEGLPKESVFANGGIPASMIDFLGDPKGLSHIMRPLAPMRKEHAALVAAAGMFNGEVIGGRAIKGSTIKKVVRHVTEGSTQAGTSVSEIVDSEVLAAQLATIDMETGEMVVVNSLDDKDVFEKLLEEHAHEFVDLAERLYPPMFTEDDMGRYTEALSHIHAPRKIKGQQNGLFPQQTFRAASILDGWKRHHVITMVGEMGTGKTVVSAAACTIKAMRRKEHNRKIIVLLPPKKDLVDKWEEEMLLALREFHPKVYKVETISDVRKAFAEKGLVIILMRETTAKMSSGWEPVYMPARRQPKHLDEVRPVLCPTCGKPLELSQEKPDKTKAHCVSCQAKKLDSAMWTVARRTNGKSDGPGYARYPLAKYIRDHYRDRYLLIIDEAHGYKASDSARAYAAQDLLASAHRTVQMTGTLYNGMASSIYYLLWRALPDFRKSWGWADSQKFINEYGLFEKITREYDNGHTSSRSGYNQYNERISEKPGIHPAMIALLLPSTVFFGIRDLEVILPPYSEHTLFVDKPEKFHFIDAYLDDIKTEAIRLMLDDKDMSLMSQLTWAKQGAWDMAAQGDYVDGHAMGALDCPWDMWPKEEALLRLVMQEKRAGRPVLCFVGQINRRDNTGRLCDLLAQYGMKGAVMRAEVKSRVEFVRTAIKGGADVIFTSAELVKEGIDLFELPTFVWLYGESKTYLVRQANRRAWRPGQDKPCKIFYLAYNKTPQAERMDRLAKKLAASQSLEGDVRQGLAAILGDEDFVSRLQDATVSTEHFESDITMDELPELESFVVTTTAPPLVDVIVEVTSRKPVRVRVTVEEIKSYSQMSLF